VQRAIEIARADPPRLMEGDFVEVLPALLAERDLDALTVVFHSASLMYLREEDRARVESTLEREGQRGSLALVSYEYVASEAMGFALDVQTWPGERRLLARLHGHGNSMEWLA
jgi:hypothetical protein